MKYLMLSMCLCLIMLTGCTRETEKDNADISQAKQTKKAMSEANRQIGMPAIVNFQERKLAKMIFELRDQENFVCHAYLFNKMTGEVGQYLGKCLGYGLPYSVQFTNPERLVNARKEMGYSTMSDSAFMTLPQPDPNGLFMPSGLSATWLMLLDSKGTARPVYVEPEIIVSPFLLHEVAVEADGTAVEGLAEVK